MPNKGKENKKHSSQLGDFEIIEDIGIPRSRTMPARRRPEGNELNQGEPVVAVQSNESMREEQPHNEEGQHRNSGIRDQNGLAPQNEEEEQQLQEQPQEEEEQEPWEEELAQPPGNPDEINGFVPQQTPRTKWSKASEANNYFWRGVGNSIGKLSVLPASIVGKFGITNGIKHVAYKKAEEGQEKRTHKLIPGREGAKFSSKENNGSVLADFRRVPTVWSYITAAKATDADGNDLAPKVTVYIEQPKTGSSRSMHYRQMGHSMIGIEYTRASKITGKKERYNIKYGFYPIGGLSLAEGAMALKGAIVPGQLKDDALQTYDISKTYSARPDQIERIAKASEKYTEQGGYGYYTRNCTTFVRDMFRVGGIATDAIDRIFPEEKVRFNSLAHGAFVFANAWNGFWDTDLQRRMGNLTQSDDLSYQGWGNKRVTKQDFDRYRETKNTAKLGVTSLAPGSSGENIRRMTDTEGQLGSYRYAPDILKTDESQDARDVDINSLNKLYRAIHSEARKLERKIYAITGMTDETLFVANREFGNWVSQLTFLGGAIETLDNARAMASENIPNNVPVPIDMLVSQQDLQNARATITEEMADVSMNYQKFLHSDSRVNTEVMNLLSTMQIAVQLIDFIYGCKQKTSDKDELTQLREQMTKKEYMVRAGNKMAMMTPSHYESYLQIHKTPEKAVAAYSRYVALDAEWQEAGGKAPKKWNSKTTKEWDRLYREEILARQFDQSHRDMLNKSSFRQSDIDYAFSLRAKECTGEVKPQGDMYTSNSSASVTYMALFFDKIYNGIQAAARSNPEDGGLSDETTQDEAIVWLNDYLKRKTEAKMSGMAMILRGITRALNKPTEAKIKTSFHYFLLNGYLKKMLPVKSNNPKVRKLGIALHLGYERDLSGKQDMTFTKTIDNLIGVVLREHVLNLELKAAKKKK